jgi:hypothetical protein
MNTNTPNAANGAAGAPNGKIVWWLVGGILTPLMFSVFTAFVGNVKDVTRLEAVIESVDRRLERLENKIEKLLERRP